MKNKNLMVGLIILCLMGAISLTTLMMSLINGNFKMLSFHPFFKISDQEIWNETYDNNIEELKIKGNISNINIMHSDDSKIRVVIYGNKNDLKLDVNDKKLDIEIKEKNCIGFCFNMKQSKIEIYLPDDYSKKINVKNNYGDIKIEQFLLADIVIEEDCGDVSVAGGNKIKVENNYGDIKIGSVKKLQVKEDCGDVFVEKGDDISIENRYGNIKIEQVLQTINIKEDCGDIKIDSLNIIKDSKIVNRFGDIKINETNDIYINSKTNLGDNKINKNNKGSETSLSLKNDCGDITVNN